MHLIEQRLHQPRHQERCDDAHGNAGAGQSHPLPKDHHHYLRPARANREADADFLRPLRHEIRQHAIDADGSQRERDGGEDRHQKTRQSRGRKGRSHHFSHGTNIGDWNVRIEVAHLVADGARHREWVAGRARHDERVANEVAASDDVPLAMRNEEFLLHRPGDTVVPLVGDDADHGDHGIAHAAAHPNLAADDGADVLPVGPCQRLVDDRHRLRRREVARIEPAAAQQPGAHGFKRAVGHDLPVTLGVAARPFLVALDVEAVVANRRRERQGAHRPGRLHARHGAHAHHQPAIEIYDLLWRIVLGCRNGEPHGQHVIGVEAQVDAAESRQAADHQPRTDDEDDGERDFGDHQRTAHPLTRSADGRLQCALAK